MQKKTLLIGNFGSGNIGDELILNFSLEKYEKDDVVVMTNEKVFSQEFTEKQFETIPFFPTGVRSFFSFIFDKKAKKDFLSLRSNVGRVVFCGGGLFAIKFRAVFLWFLVFRWTKFFCPQAEIIFEYQGVDAHLGFLSRFLMKKVFTSANKISVRDENSGNALRRLGISNYEVLDDMVYLALQEGELNSKREGSTCKVEPEIFEPATHKEKVVLLNALSKISSDLLKKIKLKFGEYRVIFVCFDPKDGLFFPSDFGEIRKPKTKTEVFALFASADVCIGERLHFLILGNAFCGSEKTFSLKKPYSEKVLSFCEKFKIDVFE